MKSLSAIASLGAVALTLCTTAQADVVRVGFASEPYPPFATPQSDGSVTGWEVDIANAVCAAAELECEIVTSSWDGLIPALTTRKIDAIAASLSITEQRRKVIDFSDKYYQTSAAVMGAKGDEITPTPEGLAGKTLGVQSASIHQTYAKRHFPDTRVREYQTQDEANQDLFAGRIDATLADILVLDDYLASDDGELCCDMKGNVAHDESILGSGVGFGVRKGDSELLERLNAGIAEIRASGRYDEISKQYFDFDIYGD